MAQVTTITPATKTTLRPLHDRLLVRRLAEQEQKHGHILTRSCVFLVGLKLCVVLAYAPFEYFLARAYVL